MMKKVAETALNAMKKAGAEKAQCTVVRSEKTEVNIEAGKLTLMRTTFENSVTLTAIVNGKKGGGQLNSWDSNAVAACAAETVELANAGQPDSAYDIAALEDGATEFSAGLDKPEENFMSSVVALQSEIAKKHPKVIYTHIAAFVKTDKLIVNTNGVSLSSSDGRYHIQGESAAKEGENVTSMNFIECHFRELPKNLLDAGNFGELLEQSERELGAAPSGEKFVGDVIFAPDCLHRLLGYYADCFLGDIALIGGTSLLKDKLGEKIASEIVNIRANPKNPELCGNALTNDGFRAGDMDIITNGVLDSFILTQYGANKTGKKRSPNTAVGCVEMDAGDVSLEDMIAGVERGIIIGGNISGGDPSENGAFSGIAKNSFLIENGKITRPIQETMVSGNILDVFRDASAVSRERRNCGIYVLPWMKSGNITIS